MSLLACVHMRGGRAHAATWQLALEACNSPSPYTDGAAAVGFESRQGCLHPLSSSHHSSSFTHHLIYLSHVCRSVSFSPFPPSSHFSSSHPSLTFVATSRPHTHSPPHCHMCSNSGHIVPTPCSVVVTSPACYSS